MSSSIPNNSSNSGQKRKRSSSDIAKQAKDSKETVDKNKICPYLDTINRTWLDFDFEHSCSITLQSGPHIYACLVCGKFFLGRGPQTPAHIHSVDENGHNVFVHLTKGTFHCLPDNYEIKDASLKDISAALHPKFTTQEIRQIDQQRSLSRDLFGKQYLPGFVGLNNLNKTDYINATVQALAHVRPLRDFFLKFGHPQNFDSSTKMILNNKKQVKIDPSTFSPLAQCFGDLVRKMWSDKRFKSNIDPHMIIQAVSVASKKKFHIGKQAEAGEFMAWLLHHLHVGIGGSSKKPGSSIVHDIFQGKVEVTTLKKNKKPIASVFDQKNPLDSIATVENDPTLVTEETISNTHFLQLTLDIPEKPLFKDEEGGLVIPQEPLVNVLNKFNGISFHDALNMQRRYRLKKLPNYLILHLARFKKNGFSMEKNPTIVAFPKSLDLGRYVMESEKEASKREKKKNIPTVEEMTSMSVSWMILFLNISFSHAQMILF